MSTFEHISALLGERAALDALKRSQHDRWGASHSGSAAVTGHSAKLLTLEGYRTPEDQEAELIAKDYLAKISRSKPTRRWLYHGFAGRWSAGPGDIVRRPLTALSDDENQARGFAHGPDAVLLKFTPGTKAMKYSAVEWITAGPFEVVEVTKEHDPFWGTPLTVVTLKP